MTLQQLTYFRKLAEIQHFTKASEELYITQPSLSYSINELEKELGVSLFERTGRNVVLNEYGRVFLRYVDTALDTIEDGMRQIRLLRDPHIGVLDLSYMYGFGDTFIPYILQIFNAIKDNNKITINLNVFHNDKAAIARILNEGSGFAFTFDTNKNINSIAIANIETHVLLNKEHPLAQKEIISIKDFDGENFIESTSDAQFYHYARKMFAKAGVKPVVIVSSDILAVRNTYVSLGYGITMSPMPVSIPNNIVVKDLDDPAKVRTVYMSWSIDHELSPTEKLFKDFFERNFAERGALPTL